MSSTHQFTHGTYDTVAIDGLMADDGFVDAASTALGFLGTLFLKSPDDDACACVLGSLHKMDIARDWPFGTGGEKRRAAELVARGTSEESEADLAHAYTRLFRGPASLPAPPWGSVYMDRDQVLNGWTWVELRSWLRSSGIAGIYDENDPEDQYGRLLTLAGELAASREASLFAELLVDHLLPWSGRFLDLFETGARDVAQSPTYEGLAVLARCTLEDLRGLVGAVPATRKLYR